MPAVTKKPQDRKAADRAFTWETEDGDTVTIPLKIRMKLIRAMSTVELDAEGMFAFLEALIPDQADVLDEMDVNDFSAMFKAWQDTYNGLQDADLGESPSS